VSANAVDAALRAPIEHVAKTLLGITEDQWFERKSIKIAPATLAKALVAFANAEGGVIVVGLHNGVVEGVGAHTQQVNALRQAAIDCTIPPVRMRSEEVLCTNDDGVDDALLVIRVDPGETVYETNSHDVFLRIGDESRRLGDDARRELSYDRGQSVFDGTPVSGIAIDDLDATQLGHYKSAIGTTLEHEAMLKNRSLLTQNDQVTVAGFLLFHESPHLEMPNAHVRIVRFLSDERGTGSRLNVEDGKDFRVEGSIPVVISRAAELMDELVPRRRALQASGQFESVPVVPRDAWLEGLVNAVIHRSYSIYGDHIRVEIYPTRIEIYSPGRFPGLADPRSPLDISRYARNPRIARVCSDLAIGQELGEGIKRIFEEMRAVGLTDPIYQQGQGHVRLTLQTVPRLDLRLAARLPARAQQIIDAMRASDVPLSTGDVADATGISRITAKRVLDALREEDLVEWLGKSPRDPRAVWRLTM
jgi:ATP-dependent DNA helicase RecG